MPTGGVNASTSANANANANAGNAAASFFTSAYSTPFAAPAAAGVKSYAASRFLEHASFGPTPASVEEVRQKGLASWIDSQFALAPSQIDGSFTENWNSDDTPGIRGRPYHEYFKKNFSTLTLSAPDQLRLRTTWALSQFIVVSEQKVQSFGVIQYFNLLQNNVFGNFADLLRAVIKSPSMGVYLDNVENKKEGSCNTCSVNENFGRELMQLFTLGVTKLNKDGTPVRDATGKLIETYSQDDVQAMARALTGWQTLWPLPAQPAPLLRSQYRYPLMATWTDSHDTGEKKLLGTTISAGGTAEQDLEKVIAILMAHPNIAPFVSVRLIQHLVTSDPSPAYIARIASVFENNGSGVRGDMKAVIKAILLDPEARRGDDAAIMETNVGKVREPVLFNSAMLRGIGCTSALYDPNGNLYMAYNQQPFNAPSVFSFFSPTHRAPGSLLLAPEQKLLNSSEFNQRLGGISWMATAAPKNLKNSGCKLDEFAAALSRSKREFINLVSARYFRGSMPPTLRDFADQLLDQMSWATPETKAANMIQFLLASPPFGVIK